MKKTKLLLMTLLTAGICNFSIAQPNTITPTIKNLKITDRNNEAVAAGGTIRIPQGGSVNLSFDIQISKPINQVCQGQLQSLYRTISGATPTFLDNYDYIYPTSPLWWTSGSTAYFDTYSKTATLYASSFFSPTAGTFFANVLDDLGTVFYGPSFPVEVIAPIANNSITANQTIYTGQTPALLNGSQPTGGYNGYTYTWQRTTGSTWSSISGANQKNHQNGALTTTTSFRRLVNSTLASQSKSNTVVVTVQQPPVITSNGNKICPGTPSITLSLSNGVNPGVTYQWQTVTCDNVVADISGATSSSYSATTMNKYRLKIVCNGVVAYSNVIFIGEVPNCSWYNPACLGGPGGGSGDAALLADLKDQSVVNTLAVYPNPNNGQFIIALTSTEDNETTVSVVDVLGREVIKEVYSIVKGENKLEIGITNYPKGIYYVRVQNASQQLQMKMVYQ